MSSVYDRKTINEAIPDLRTTGSFFKYIGSYNFLNVTTMATLYSVRSGDKKVSSFVDYYLNNSETLTDADARSLGEILKNVYEHKWNQIASALRKEYDILKNIDIKEDVTEYNTHTIQKTNNYGEQKTTNEFGEIMNTFEQGAITVENEIGARNTTNTKGQQETNTLNKTNGFNGGLVDDTSTQTTNNSYIDTTQEQATIDKTLTSSDTDIDTTMEHTNTTTIDAYVDSENTNNIVNNQKTFDRDGQEGDSQDKILKELELRKYDFLTMMFKDIDSYLTLKVYC